MMMKLEMISAGIANHNEMALWVAISYSPSSMEDNREIKQCMDERLAVAKEEITDNKNDGLSAID